MNKIMGLDVGTKRIGVSLSDALGFTAQPYETIPRQPEENAIAAIKKICTENNVKKTIEVLQKSEGFIKRQLAEAVQMPQVPKLKFEIDKGTTATIRINEILKNLDIPEEEE